MKIFTPLDATETEKKIISAINEHENHIKLISRQYGEALGKINKLEQRITELEKFKREQLMKQQNTF